MSFQTPARSLSWGLHQIETGRSLKLVQKEKQRERAVMFYFPLRMFAVPVMLVDRNAQQHNKQNKTNGNDDAGAVR